MTQEVVRRRLGETQRMLTVIGEILTTVSSRIFGFPSAEAFPAGSSNAPFEDSQAFEIYRDFFFVSQHVFFPHPTFFDRTRSWEASTRLIPLLLAAAAAKTHPWIEDLRTQGKYSKDEDVARNLGGIVIIRTFLSFSLEVEIQGRWPWSRVAPERTSTKR